MTLITLFPKFIVLESTEDIPISKLSPFIIKKILSFLKKKVKSVKKKKKKKKKANQQYPTSRRTKKTLDLLLEQKYFHKLKIKVYPYNSLNSLKDVDLSICTLDEIKNNLSEQIVTDAKQIYVKKNNQIIPTNSYIINFNTPKSPKIKIEYIITKVETFIPNPLRCLNCQKFGHLKEK